MDIQHRAAIPINYGRDYHSHPHKTYHFQETHESQVLPIESLLDHGNRAFPWKCPLQRWFHLGTQGTRWCLLGSSVASHIVLETGKLLPLRHQKLLEGGIRWLTSACIKMEWTPGAYTGKKYVSSKPEMASWIPSVPEASVPCDNLLD